ncbi:MAG: glycerol-3-phosphate 1-O-acyltransferase PlsY, partial [Thermoleophilia bacterium]
MNEAFAVAAAYLLGSIPFGYLVGRARGVDIRTVGSRNVGATNVFRTLGKPIGIAVMALDIIKGIAAVVVARLITDDPWPLIAAGAAVAGHVYPVWLRFSGGKGVAVGAGVAIGLVPMAALVLVPVWVLIVALTRYVSLASIVAAVAFAPTVWAFGYDTATVVFAAVISVAVIWRHRGNMGRLARGEQLRLDIRRG